MYKLHALLQAEGPALCSRLFPTGVYLNSEFAAHVHLHERSEDGPRPARAPRGKGSGTSAPCQGRPPTASAGSRLGQELLTYLPKLTAGAEGYSELKLSKDDCANVSSAILFLVELKNKNL